MTKIFFNGLLASGWWCAPHRYEVPPVPGTKPLDCLDALAEVQSPLSFSVWYGTKEIGYAQSHRVVSDRIFVHLVFNDASEKRHQALTSGDADIGWKYTKKHGLALLGLEFTWKKKAMESLDSMVTSSHTSQQKVL